MTAAVAFRFMTINGEPLDVDVWKYIHRLQTCLKTLLFFYFLCFCVQKNTNMATMRVFSLKNRLNISRTIKYY